MTVSPNDTRNGRSGWPLHGQPPLDEIRRVERRLVRLRKRRSRLDLQIDRPTHVVRMLGGSNAA